MEFTSPDVVVVGSLNLDEVCSVPDLPRPGETLSATRRESHLGGKGFNQAVAAARAGGSVAMVGRVGDDAAGEQLRSWLDDEGVDTRHVHLDADAPTGTAFITVDPLGRNTIVLDAGANGRLAVADVEQARPLLAAAKVVVAQQEVPEDVVVAAASMTTGLFVLNPAPARRLGAKLAARVDVLVPNESELSTLVGDTLEPGAALARLARDLSPRCHLIATLGSDGALVRTNDGAELLIAPVPVTPVDTTGAGDCFVGVLAMGLAQGSDVPTATRHAVLAAGLSTTLPGAARSMPTATQVKAVGAAGVPGHVSKGT